MDLEKTKKNYKWDPSRGDYSKSYVSYERRILERKHRKRFYLIILYIFLIIITVTVLFIKFN